MSNEDIFFFGNSDIYAGLSRTYTSLIPISRIKKFISECDEPVEVLLYVGQQEATLLRSAYELLLLRFGGKVNHRITLTSYLDLKSLLSLEFGLQDINTIYLPNTERNFAKGEFRASNYRKLIENTEIKQYFYHDTQNLKYKSSLFQHILCQISKYDHSG